LSEQNWERFDGINFDVEPHLMGGRHCFDVNDVRVSCCTPDTTNCDPRDPPTNPDVAYTRYNSWSTGTESSDDNRLYNLKWIQNLTMSLRACRAILDQYEIDTGHKMTLSLTLGPDYHFYVDRLVERMNDTDAATDNFCEDNSDPVCCDPDGDGYPDPGVTCAASPESTPIDYITIMNYLDNADNQNSNVNNPALRTLFMGEEDLLPNDSTKNIFVGGVLPNLANWTNIPVVFGAETQPFVADKMTFVEEGYAIMHQEFDKVFNLQRNQDLGVAVHHYLPHSYTCMCSNGPPILMLPSNYLLGIFTKCLPP
jgi:hypothetical protein